jgi:Macrocin-O-methyltransferase (TylF)
VSTLRIRSRRVAVRLVPIAVSWSRPVLRPIIAALPPRLRGRLTALQVRLGVMDGVTLVPPIELEEALGSVLDRVRTSAGQEPGDVATYLEFGVYVGTSMTCMYRAAERRRLSKFRFVGFDSFQGMPPEAPDTDDKRFRPGDLHAGLETTRANLARNRVPIDRIELVPGWFEETLTAGTRERLGLRRADVVMMDCVLSSSTRLALDFAEPLIHDRTVIIFDDWNSLDLGDNGLGEAQAFAGWLAAHPDLSAEPIEELQYTRDARGFLVTRSARTDQAPSGPTSARP